MAYCVVTGLLQVIYASLVGTHPYNAFIAGFGSAVGSFVFAGKPSFLHFVAHIYIYIYRIQSDINWFVAMFDVANLRIKMNPENKGQFVGTTEGAFSEFVFCNIILHFVVAHFLG